MGEEPMVGVDTLAITVGVGPSAENSKNETFLKSVEFTGVENLVAALGMHSDVPTEDKLVVLLSFMGGPVLFWKLNAEASLGYSGIGSAVVKPCGIAGTYGRGGKELVVSHDDHFPLIDMMESISREDLAAVLTEIVVERATSLRFDLCVGKGAPTTDLSALIDAARMPWMKKHS